MALQQAAGASAVRRGSPRASKSSTFSEEEEILDEIELEKKRLRDRFNEANNHAETTEDATMLSMTFNSDVAEIDSVASFDNIQAEQSEIYSDYSEVVSDRPISKLQKRMSEPVNSVSDEKITQSVHIEMENRYKLLSENSRLRHRLMLCGLELSRRKRHFVTFGSVLDDSKSFESMSLVSRHLAEEYKIRMNDERIINSLVGKMQRLNSKLRQLDSELSQYITNKKKMQNHLREYQITMHGENSKYLIEDYKNTEGIQIASTLYRQLCDTLKSIETEKKSLLSENVSLKTVNMLQIKALNEINEREKMQGSRAQVLYLKNELQYLQIEAREAEKRQRMSRKKRRVISEALRLEKIINWDLKALVLERDPLHPKNRYYQIALLHITAGSDEESLFFPPSPPLSPNSISPSPTKSVKEFMDK